MSNQPAESTPSNHADRRTFIKAAGAAALATAVAPTILRAADKSGGKRPVVGSGEFTYECIHGWGELPEGAHYGNASHGVAVDKAGLIYITHYGSPGSIFVFDPDGKFVRSLGDEHRIGEHACGHGIDIREEDGEEFIYLSPSESSLSFAKMNLKGEVLWQRGRKELHAYSGKYGEQQRYRPTNASFSPDGGYFLGDGYGAGLIHQFDKSDGYIRTIGAPGEAAGEFRTPHGQWLDERDGTAKLVVADRANKRLQWFDMNGKHVKTLDGFLFPADIDIQGEVMLVPDLHARITLLDKDNKVIAHLGDDPEWIKQVTASGFPVRSNPKLWRPGLFIHPHDACFDRDGNIYVVEWVATGRVTKLQKV